MPPQVALRDRRLVEGPAGPGFSPYPTLDKAAFRRAWPPPRAWRRPSRHVVPRRSLVRHVSDTATVGARATPATSEPQTFDFTTPRTYNRPTLAAAGANAWPASLADWGYGQLQEMPHHVIGRGRGLERFLLSDCADCRPVKPHDRPTRPTGRRRRMRGS